MAISGFSVNISDNEPVMKMQHDIKDIQMTVRVNQFKFDSRIQTVNIISKFQ